MVAAYLLKANNVLKSQSEKLPEIIFLSLGTGREIQAIFGNNPGAAGFVCEIFGPDRYRFGV